MAAGPTADGADVFFAAPDERGEAEFWTEADGAGPKVRRRHRAPRRRPAPTAHAATASAPKGVRQRIAAAWAAETSARRALSGRSAGDGGPPRRNRKIAAGLVGIVALLALGLAVAEATWNDDGGSDQAAAESGASGSSDGGGAAGSSSYDAEDRAADDVAAVESEIVDAPTTARTGTKTRSKPATPTTTAPKAGGDRPAATVPVPKPSGASPATPTTPNPANPATPVPTTAAPTPTTAPPPTPTTAAPKPPAAPTVQTFTAKAASSAGGACPPLQWATTFTWATTNATSVSITGLLEATQANLPGDGSRVVCRLLPTSPLGGWTLTASGAGGATTAKA